MTLDMFGQVDSYEAYPIGVGGGVVVRAPTVSGPQCQAGTRCWFELGSSELDEKSWFNISMRIEIPGRWGQICAVIWMFIAKAKLL